MSNEQIKQQLEELQRQNAYLSEQLNDAAESVQEWGNYADSYFQDKWDLAGDVQKYKDAANATAAQSAAWLEASHIEWMKGLKPVLWISPAELPFEREAQNIYTTTDNFDDCSLPLYAIPTKKD